MVQGPKDAGNYVNNNPINMGGAVSQGELLSNKKDAEEASTAPKFGDVYKQIQAKYGEKAEKPREIKKTLGKDDFLRIMITQMKNQDPTSPFKAEQMATEIAQFTTVEQLQNINQGISKMSSQNRPLEQMAMTNLIGKTVTIDKDRFPHSEGSNETLSFFLPRDASTVMASVINESGEVVYDKELGAQKAGAVDFVWDGVKKNTLPAKSGNYTLKVEAQDARGQPVETNPKAQAKIIGVSFEGLEPVFLVGDAKRQEKITLRNIVKVETDTSQLPNGQGIVPFQEKQSKTPNWISFQKGVGSSTFTPGAPSVQNGAHPEAAKALEKLQNQEVLGPGFQEKGFPHGLNDSDESQPAIMKGGENK